MLAEQMDDMIAIDGAMNRQLYRRIDTTKEWMENNYWHLLPEAQNADLVSINPFWADYANHRDGDFLSTHFATANRNFTEMMLALAVTDLPLEPVEDNTKYVDNSVTITADAPMIVLHQQNNPVPLNQGETKLLVSENFFRKDDRYRHEGAVQYDKFVTERFQSHVVYGSQVVLTNPTSTPMTIELLVQIPNGSLPVAGSQETRTTGFQMDAFATQTFEYSFYFPTAGTFSHYPAHVSSNEQVVAVAAGLKFNVVNDGEPEDKESWGWVSQNGDPDQVLEFLKKENVLRIDLPKIAFRMQDETFFKAAIKTLKSRRAYNHLLWSYSIKHNDTDAIAEYLAHEAKITNYSGLVIESPVLTLDPVLRNWYQQREYWPLVNSRAHRLGQQRKILNPEFFQQYQTLMRVLASRRELTSDDHLAVTGYLLLQDRIEESLAHFANVSLDKVDAAMQYDYCDAYLDLYREDPDAAYVKAEKYVDYPVDHWREKFAAITAMVREIRGEDNDVVDPEDRDQRQAKLAATSPAIDFAIESRQGTVTWQNVDSLTINYYEMDIELLFSRNPFARDQLDGFSLIRPNLTQTVSLKSDAKKETQATSGDYQFDLPEEFSNRNVLVEIVAGEKRQQQPSFAHSLDVRVMENYGQVAVTLHDADKSETDESTNGKAVSKAYVKVYARHANGESKFHKDGYTDLRGRFDYVSQSNQSLDGITDYAILIVSDEAGAVIREAKPPLE